MKKVSQEETTECTFECMRREALEGRTINEMVNWKMVSGGWRSQGTSFSHNQILRWLNLHRSLDYCELLTD